MDITQINHNQPKAYGPQLEYDYRHRRQSQHAWTIKQFHDRVHNNVKLVQLEFDVLVNNINYDAHIVVPGDSNPTQFINSTLAALAPIATWVIEFTPNPCVKIAANFKINTSSPTTQFGKVTHMVESLPHQPKHVGTRANHTVPNRVGKSVSCILESSFVIKSTPCVKTESDDESESDDEVCSKLDRAISVIQAVLPPPTPKSLESVEYYQLLFKTLDIYSGGQIKPLKPTTPNILVGDESNCILFAYDNIAFSTPINATRLSKVDELNALLNDQSMSGTVRNVFCIKTMRKFIDKHTITNIRKMPTTVQELLGITSASASCIVTLPTVRGTKVISFSHKSGGKSVVVTDCNNQYTQINLLDKIEQYIYRNRTIYTIRITTPFGTQ